MSTKQTPNYTFALIIVIAVCFLIGFVTTMNNSMIEFCKKAFDLSDAQGQLVNTAFYGAYAMSIPFGFMMSKIGYKKTCSSWYWLYHQLGSDFYQFTS